MKASSRARGSVHLWEPASVLPSQLAVRQSPKQCGELRLAAAVFEDALRCVIRNTAWHRGPLWRDFEEARDWFKDDRRAWPFAFENVCDLLALDATEVRAQVERLLSRQLNKSVAPHS